MPPRYTAVYLGRVLLLACTLSGWLHPSTVPGAVVSNRLPSGDGPDWESLEADEMIGFTMMEARAAYTTGAWAKALELVAAVRSKRPGRPKIMLVSVYVNLQLGNHEAALKDLDQALKIDPENTKVLRLMGLCNEALGRNEAAAANYIALNERQPLNEKPYYALGAVYFRLGEVDKAIAAYQKPVAIKPEDARAHEALGAAYYQAERYPEAILSFTRALVLNPDYAEAHNSLGTTYFARGEKKKGIDQVRLAIKIEPRYAKAYSNLASMLATGEAYPAALSNLTIALSLNLLDGNSWNTLLLTLERSLGGDDKEGDLEPPKGLSGDERASWYLEAYGKAMGSGTFQSGARHLIHGLQANFNRADILNQLGLLLVQSPYAALSPLLLQMAVAVEPDFEPANKNLAIYYRQLGREQLAMVRTNMEKQVEENPDNLQAHQQLGRVFSAQGHFEQAIPHYLACVRLEPTNVASRISLSYVFYQAGHLDAALETLLTGIQLDPHSKQAWGKLLLAADMMQPNDHSQKRVDLPQPREGLQFDDKGLALWHFRQARKYDIKGTNEWVLAARHLGESIRLDTSIPASYYLYGQLARRHLSKRMAVPFYKRATDLLPGTALLEEEFAQVRREAAVEADEARARALQQRLHEEPGNSEVAFALAKVLLRHKKTQEAIQALQQGLENNPSNHVVRLALARALYEEGDIDAAIGQVDELLQRGLRSPSILFQRAWLMLEKPAASDADLQRAVSLLMRARNMEGNATPVLFIQTLARAYHLQGDRAKAVQTAEEAILAAMAKKDEDQARQISRELERYKQTLP
jgi:tetratricopeptide (TPR) repeat protein